MTKLEFIKSTLEYMGFKPKIDDDGDLMIRYQLKSIYFLVGVEDEQFLAVLFPQFHEVEEGEETLVLTVCNKMTREFKLVKMYIDSTLKNVSACCEFFYSDDDSLKSNIRHALDILGLVRSGFYRIKNELSE